MSTLCAMLTMGQETTLAQAWRGLTWFYIYIYYIYIIYIYIYEHHSALIDSIDLGHDRFRIFATMMVGVDLSIHQCPCVKNLRVELRYLESEVTLF